MHCNNKNNWASSVCFTLYRYGYGHVWENQGVCDIRAFLCEFKQRLIDCYLQGWNSDINSKDRYAFFSSFKQTHWLSQYLLTVKNVALKRNLVRLRLGVSFLKPHRLRFSKTQENFDCPFCEDTYESEIHFLLVCPKYSVLREKYIPAKFYTRPSAHKMALLLADTRHATTLAIYVSKAFALRNEQK